MLNEIIQVKDLPSDLIQGKCSLNVRNFCKYYVSCGSFSNILRNSLCRLSLRNTSLDVKKFCSLDPPHLAFRKNLQLARERAGYND